MKYLLLILSFSITASILAQDWSARTTTTSRSYGFNLCETNDGFIGIGTDSLTFGDESTGTSLVKLNRCGTILWETALAPPFPTNEFAGMAITNLNDGNYAGWSAIGTDSIYLFKLNPEGEIIWGNILGTDYYLSHFRPTAGIEEDNDGNLYVFTLEVLYKFDSSGILLWSLDFFATENLNCHDFKLDPDGYPNLTAINMVTGSTKLIKTTNTGEISLIKDTYFDYLSTFEYHDTGILIGGNLHQERVLRLFDFEGDTLSTQHLPFYTGNPWLLDHADEISTSITKMDLLENGNLALRSNHTSMYFGGFPWIYATVFEYDFSTETIISEYEINDAYSSKISAYYSGDVIATADGGFAAFGSSYLETESDYQMTIWKFNDDCGLNISNHTNYECKIYPNPIIGNFNLISPLELMGTTYTINDISGKKIASGVIQNTHTVIQLELDAGYYYLSYMTNNPFTIPFYKQ